MVAKILRTVGWVLYGLMFLAWLGSNLQYNPLDYCLFNIAAFIIIGGILFLADWLENKSYPKKVSLFAVLCFLLGLLIILPVENGLFFGIVSVLSLICGIIFIISKIKHKKEQTKLLGFPLFLIGVIFAGIILVLAILSIVFKLPKV